MNATDLAAQQLEDLLNEECKCESDHYADSNRECSRKVTHRLTIQCASDTRLVCWNQFHYSTTHMTGFYFCLFCKNPAEDCWQIIPV